MMMMAGNTMTGRKNMEGRAILFNRVVHCFQYLMYHSPYWFNTSYFWIDYPHIMMTRDIKSYYLMQTAFFIQQLYALHVEKRRKDHFAMVTHHVITITLLVSSYYSNFTRIGNAVLCSMDLSDLLLSVSVFQLYRVILFLTYLCTTYRHTVGQDPQVPEFLYLVRYGFCCIRYWMANHTSWILYSHHMGNCM